MNAASSDRARLIFVANTMYSNILSGGDVHTFNMATSAISAGYPVHFLCGHACKAEVERRQLPVTLTVTDGGTLRARDFSRLGGQLSLLPDYGRRLRGTIRHLSEIDQNDIVYASSEFWWDTVPVIRSKARRKTMFLAMDSPTLGEIVRQSRPDVKRLRLPSLHYWMSQQLSLRWFRFCRRKRMMYVHPNQVPRLLRLGYLPNELALISSGFDLTRVEATPAQAKQYDAVWTGRVHHQKGIDDLLATLAALAAQLKGFRALLIGNVRDALEPRIRALGIADQVTFAGFVSEEEKFRLLKASRVFLMPSRYESWGTVIAEALASDLPVVAYDLAAYRPVFGDLLCYVVPFDARGFQRAAIDLMQKARAGEKVLDETLLARFKRDTTWEAAGQRFLGALSSLGD